MMVTITLEKQLLPRDYRPLMCDLLKSVLTANEAHNAGAAYFTPACKKNFCFSVYLPKCTFESHLLLHHGYFKIIISTLEADVYTDFYESACQMKHRSMALQGNRFSITDILPITEKQITSPMVEIRMLSPLIIKKEPEDTPGTQTYLGLGDMDFLSSFRFACHAACERVPAHEIESLSISPWEEGAFKETHILHRGRFYKGTLGKLRLQGSVPLLNMLYCTGIGNLRQEGFGLFELL